jgi:hypothetical protein
MLQALSAYPSVAQAHLADSARRDAQSHASPPPAFALSIRRSCVLAQKVYTGSLGQQCPRGTHGAGRCWCCLHAENPQRKGKAISLRLASVGYALPCPVHGDQTPNMYVLARICAWHLSKSSARPSVCSTTLMTCACDGSRILPKMDGTGLGPGPTRVGLKM